MIPPIAPMIKPFLPPDEPEDIAGEAASKVLPEIFPANLVVSFFAIPIPEDIVAFVVTLVTGATEVLETRSLTRIICGSPGFAAADIAEAL